MILRAGAEFVRQELRCGGIFTYVMCLYFTGSIANMLGVLYYYDQSFTGYDI